MIKVIMVLIVTSGNHVTLVNGGVFDDEGACRRAMVATASMLSDDALHATQAICVGADVPEASK
jgi:hypothetical protein